MKHLQTFEYRGNADKTNKDKDVNYVKFLYHKLRLDYVSYGKIDIMTDYFNNYNVPLKISICMGGEIDPEFFKSILIFFEDCKGTIIIQNNGEILYYQIELSKIFLDKLDVEMDAKKYNL